MKVAWPTRKQTRDNTIIVIIVSLGVAIFLGVIDYLLEQGVISFLK